MLRGNGFVIERAHGINYGGESLRSGTFDPVEVATKRGLYDEIDSCYLLAYVCRRPRRPSARALVDRTAWKVAGPHTPTRQGAPRGATPLRHASENPGDPRTTQRSMGDMSA